jgi:hypothetical protein
MFVPVMPPLRLRATKMVAPTTAITTAIIVAMIRRPPLLLPLFRRDVDDDDDDRAVVNADAWKNASSTGDASVAP